MKKIRLLALFVVISVSLLAAPSVVSLDEATGRLQELALEVKDPQTQKLIQEALKSAESVLRMGTKVSPEMAKKARMKVQKVIAVVHARALDSHFHHKHCHKHSSSSSSSSSSCDVCHEISEVASEVEECCEDIQSRINAIISSIEGDSACQIPFVIDTVPVTLTESGKYCVTADLVYNGAETAITVNADNVTINFANHSLTLTNQDAQGILAQDVNEFTLENDIIQGSSVFQTDSSVAVHLSNVNKATLSNIYTKNTTKGILIEFSEDIDVLRCLLEAHEGSAYTDPITTKPAGVTNGAGVWVSNSNGVTVDGSTFRALSVTEFPSTRSSTAFVIDDFSSNVSITNSNFYDWLGTIYAQSVDGLLIDQCQTVANEFSLLQFVQIGSCSEIGQANDVIIRNSTFNKGGSSTSGFDGILLLSGNGCLLENVVIDANLDILGGYAPALLHIGIGDCASYSDVLAKNCLFKGAALGAVRIEVGSDVLIEDSQITTSTGVAVRIFEGSTGCLVNNCTVHGSSGARINTVDSTNGFRNNLVYGSTLSDGINVSGPNNITNNSFYGNDQGIFVSSGTPEIYFNTSCNNFTQDCVSVVTAQSPGDIAIAGSTVCCNLEDE